MGNRTTDRIGQTDATRLWLLEKDMDELETALGAIKDEIKGLTRVMTGILVSVATASILLAVNIAIGALGG